MRYILYCFVMAILVAGCHRPEDYLLGPSRTDQVLSVTFSSTTVAADGISRVTVTAQIDPRTDVDKRNVTFTTTAGTRIAGGKEGLSITVPADTSGRAAVELRSSNIPGTAQLEVTVASVSRRISSARQPGRRTLLPPSTVRQPKQRRSSGRRCRTACTCRWMLPHSRREAAPRYGSRSCGQPAASVRICACPIQREQAQARQSDRLVARRWQRARWLRRRSTSGRPRFSGSSRSEPQLKVEPQPQLHCESFHKAVRRVIGHDAVVARLRRCPTCIDGGWRPAPATVVGSNESGSSQHELKRVRVATASL